MQQKKGNKMLALVCLMAFVQPEAGFRKTVETWQASTFKVVWQPKMTLVVGTVKRPANRQYELVPVTTGLRQNPKVLILKMVFKNKPGLNAAVMEWMKLKYTIEGEYDEVLIWKDDKTSKKIKVNE